ncbi:hypothetical protein MLD38_001211 [Melastoma candidum]|uniref:Uncharacterized protein n=1 Tax=Melastoma candidum TaxID=119954 RepID=A0ACB9SHE8_9MYRT|nr:hypothetical protein MLD38_001211 [Melastoma candidum]
MAQRSQVSRLTLQVDLTCSADKFYGMFRKNMGQLVQMFPENLKGYRFVQGNEFGNGAVVLWNYNLGTPSTVKARHDTNDATKAITFTVLEGDLLRIFKNFKVKLQVERGVAKWSFEFEKINPNSPNPTEYLDFVNKVSKGLNAQLGRA